MFSECHFGNFLLAFVGFWQFFSLVSLQIAKKAYEIFLSLKCSDKSRTTCIGADTVYENFEVDKLFKSLNLRIYHL